MTAYKASYYNVIVPVDETDEFLFYNSLTGGLVVLDRPSGEAFLARTSDSALVNVQDEDDSLANDMIEKGFLVRQDIDETALYHEWYSRGVAERATRKVASIGLTVGTTITCNMDCPYCFEFVKPNKSLRDPAVMEALIGYLEGMVARSTVERWGAFDITWYGGEPLINKDAITTLTPKLLEFCRKNGMKYSATVITNGILLTDEAWQTLKDNSVKHIQVTIDGGRETHNKYRPLKNPKARNYDQILENLARMPEGMTLTIRVNTDRNVVQTIPDLMKDLEQHGIWPQRYKEVTVSLSYLRGYEEVGTIKDIKYLTKEEFYFEKLKFTRNRVAQFNRWTSEYGGKKAKMNWVLPEKMSPDECGTWASPYHIVLDSDGNIHKCWETIHDKQGVLGSVNDEWRIDQFINHTTYKRTEFHPTCATCKFLPVCEPLSCTQNAIHSKELPCTVWKSSHQALLKEQYLAMVNEPDLVSLPMGKENKALGHKYR